jgi:hypothetical protein
MVPTDDDAEDTPPFDSTESSGRFDFVRRMAAAGLGAVFMSEEGIRRLASQLKLPKEAMGLLLNQAEKAKDDLGRIVSDELRKFLQSDRLRDELLKMIAGMTLEVRAEVKLVPDRVKGEAPSLLPKVKVTELKTKHERAENKKKNDD